MSWTKEEMRSMLEDVVTVLDLSEDMIEQHGPLGTAPAELVRLVLERKDREILMLKSGMKAVELLNEKASEPEWIKFSDKLPEFKVSVLAIDIYGYCDVVDVQIIEGMVCICMNQGYTLVSDSRYTHWMPLPNKPN